VNFIGTAKSAELLMSECDSCGLGDKIDFMDTLKIKNVQVSLVVWQAKSIWM
jgi:hypothetical protein